jgi:ABC-type antimicrobial peptide transport system permease subunit
VEQRHLRAIWHDELANLFRVSLEPGASPSVVRAAMLRKLGPSGGYYVLTAGEFVGGIQAALGQFFRATWALQIIASLVGVIGILNAQLAEVLDRAADIRLLRTIGVAGRDIVRSVMLECGALGALGGACGVLLGSMLSAQVVTSALRLVTGWQIPFVLPVESLAVAVASATLVSALAGYVPARAAAAVKPAYQGVD